MFFGAPPLAEQHYQTLSRPALSKWLVVEMSRFCSGSEIGRRPPPERRADGKTTDIVVGTHTGKRIHRSKTWACSSRITAPVCVRHKEQMKAFRAEVDVLALTATPFPPALWAWR
jgi:transcription-repair coupling factor (superfamily II helicase)